MFVITYFLSERCIQRFLHKCLKGPIKHNEAVFFKHAQWYIDQRMLGSCKSYISLSIS